MLRKFKTVALLATVAAAMIPAAASAGDKIPAYDKNDMTILDDRGNCVLTKWDGMVGGCGGVSNVGNIIFFDFDSAKLTAESKQKLDGLYRKLSNDSSRVLRANIVGYADEIGSDSYNQKLSERRANAVHSYLTGMGYEDANVTDVRALGSRSSAGKCPMTLSHKDRVACLWQDRRVEVELEYLHNNRRVIR